MRLTTLACGLLLGLWATAGAAETDARTAEQIRDCSRDNFPNRTASQSFNLTNVDASGVEAQQEGEMRWRLTDEGLSEFNICFQSPPKLRGSCYLVLEREDTDNIFVFLPSLNRVKRVLGGATSQSILGTDISYADIKQMQGMAAGGTVERLEDGQIEEQPVYVVEGRPDPSQQSPYNRVVSHVDQGNCVPLQVDFYGLGDKLSKRLHVRHQTLRQVDGRWMVHDLVVRDLLNETRTEISFEEIEYDSDIASRVFNRRSFYLAP